MTDRIVEEYLADYIGRRVLALAERELAVQPPGGIIALSPAQH